MYLYILIFISLFSFCCSLSIQEAYNSVSREMKVTHLLATIHSNQQTEENRQMAAVLLRRLFVYDFYELYNDVSLYINIYMC